MRILVVEDDENLNDYVCTQLQNNGYETVKSLNGDDAYNALSKTYFDLILLDLNLGDTDGMDILKFIRKQNKIVPVMIVSSTTEDSVKVEGFRQGVDDYMTKPFYIKELLLRVKRMLDRMKYLNYEKKPIKSVYQAGIFSLDIDKRVICKNDEELSCRKMVFDLMLYFMQNENIVLSFSQIYQNVWHENVPENENQLNSNLYANIYALRNLIEDDPKNPKYIVSVNKSGYMFVSK